MREGGRGVGEIKTRCDIIALDEGRRKGGREGGREERTDLLEAPVQAIAGRHEVLDVVEAGEVGAEEVEEPREGGREGGREGRGE